MIHEYKGRTPILQESALRSNAVPFNQWNFDADFSGYDFLEEVLQRRATIALDASPFLNLQAIILEAWAHYWRLGASPMISDNGNGAWMKVGPYRLAFNHSGTKLTVRQGNRYGWMVDAHECDDWDWPEFIKGCHEIFGISALPLPESIGKISGALLPFQRPHRAILELKTPWAATMLAWRAYKGSRMEALSLGSFEGIGLDISSAFPYSASQLPMIYPCKWLESPEYQGDAFYGFAEIDVNIPSDLRASPLAVRIKRGDDPELLFPAGRIRCHVSMPEMQLLNQMEIPFQIREAWWGYPDTQEYPFHDLMQGLWKLRQYDAASAKALSVACIGQLGSAVPLNQRQCQSRGAWNPIYAAHILADVRCRIYRKAMEVGLENVKAFTVDGLIVSPEVQQSYQKGFGQWRQESKGQFLVANDYIKDRPGHSLVRGAISATPESIGESHFSLPEDIYVGLKLALTDSHFEGKAGQTIPHYAEIPIGFFHRKSPEGLTRRDFLEREI